MTLVFRDVNWGCEKFLLMRPEALSLISASRKGTRGSARGIQSKHLQ